MLTCSTNDWEMFSGTKSAFLKTSLIKSFSGEFSKSIKTATIDGNTYYYLIDKENNKYKVSIKVSDKLPYLKADQSIKIGYSQEAEITIIKKIF